MRGWRRKILHPNLNFSSTFSKMYQNEEIEKENCSSRPHFPSNFSKICQNEETEKENRSSRSQFFCFVSQNLPQWGNRKEKLFVSTKFFFYIFQNLPKWGDEDGKLFISVLIFHLHYSKFKKMKGWRRKIVHISFNFPSTFSNIYHNEGMEKENRSSKFQFSFYIFQNLTN